MAGRPTSYTPELGDKICERLVCGRGDKPESLRSICSAEDMPDAKTVYRWLARHEEFCQQYTRARQMQAEVFYDENIEIADNATDDVIFLADEDSSGEGARPAIKHSAIARARLQIDTRKWAMSKMLPRKYGDRTDVNLGGQPDNPVRVDASVSLTPDEAYRKMLDGDV
jgi:hypothetical protein